MRIFLSWLLVITNLLALVLCFAFEQLRGVPFYVVGFVCGLIGFLGDE